MCKLFTVLFREQNIYFLPKCWFIKIAEEVTLTRLVQPDYSFVETQGYQRAQSGRIAAKLVEWSKWKEKRITEARTAKFSVSLAEGATGLYYA